MKVAILFSGGKDSTYAIEHAMQKGWDIAYLLSVKPNRTDCYLFHFATVEHTKTLAKALGLKHKLIKCSVADPKREAMLIKKVIEKNRVDALLLGGTGLQETQIKSLQDILMPLNVKVFAAHNGLDHEKIFREMISKGYKILITQVATDGGDKWLGREINENNFEEFKKDSIKYGFHIGFDGGYMDSLVTDGPIFKKKISILNSEKVIESNYNGYLKIDKLNII